MDEMFTPRVLIGTNVDVISPFPLSYLERLIKWTHQYKSLITDDFSESDDATMTEKLYDHITTLNSYGVVDKHNKIELAADGPIVVGGFFIEPGANPLNCYVHVISQRRAWGKELMDEGLELIVKDLFDTQPELNRISGYMFANNRAITNFAERHGFRREGILREMTKVNGKLRDVALYGMTRTNYNKAQVAEEMT